MKRALAYYLEHKPFFENALAFILDNSRHEAARGTVCSNGFQDYASGLVALSKHDRLLALTAALYGLALADFEWRDRARSVPYDPEVHGRISFAWRED